MVQIDVLILPHGPQELVCDLDIYGDCTANVDAFLALLAQHQKPIPTTKELKAAFAQLDADKSGSITAKELKHYLTSVGDKLSDEEVRLLSAGQCRVAFAQRRGRAWSLGPRPQSACPHAVPQIEQMIKDIDKDGDGEIDYNEFANLMKL